MDYEKAYKEALERAKKELQTCGSMECDAAKQLFRLFPELKESEDERIRKALVRFHKSTIDIDGIKGADILAWLEKQGTPQDKGEISDGYHTFNELYYYRMLYNAAFFNMLPKEWVHKSKRHNDGEECFGGGWFIVMANLPTGQISNHYELKDWDLFQIPEKEVADKWDGHTPQEAADRLHKYLLEKQSEQKPFDHEHATITQKDFASVGETATIELSSPIDCGDRIYHVSHKPIEKQGEQKPAVTDFNAKDWYVSKVDGKIHDMTYNPADKVEPRFKVKYAGSEYNVLEVKDIAGVTFYGIEDEPNHIDYVQADNCEIISGYAIKENGSSYPTNPAVFSEQKPFDYKNANIQQKDFAPKQEWSEEDDYNLQCMIAKVTCDIQQGYIGRNNELIDWLKSLKDRIGG